MNYVLVFCKQGKEKAVGEFYSDLGYSVELPVITKLVRKNRRSRQRVLRDFVAIKGAIFLDNLALCHDQQKFDAPQYQKGFLTDHLGLVSLIDEKEVQVFVDRVSELSDTNKSGSVKGDRLSWRRGEACVIHHPAFDGETGVVTHIKDGHAKVDIDNRDLAFGVTISLALLSKPDDKDCHQV